MDAAPSCLVVFFFFEEVADLHELLPKGMRALQIAPPAPAKCYCGCCWGCSCCRLLLFIELHKKDNTTAVPAAAANYRCWCPSSVHFYVPLTLFLEALDVVLEV